MRVALRALGLPVDARVAGEVGAAWGGRVAWGRPGGPVGGCRRGRGECGAGGGQSLQGAGSGCGGGGSSHGVPLAFRTEGAAAAERRRNEKRPLRTWLFVKSRKTPFAAGAAWPGPGWAPLPQMAPCFHVKQVVDNALCILSLKHELRAWGIHPGGACVPASADGPRASVSLPPPAEAPCCPRLCRPPSPLLLSLLSLPQKCCLTLPIPQAKGTPPPGRPLTALWGSLLPHPAQSLT